MSEQMKKILYYENILEFKKNTGTQLLLNEVNHWKLCRICLFDAGYDKFVDCTNLCVMDVDGGLANVQDILDDIAIGSKLPAEFPQKICKPCLNKITQLYFFKIQITRAALVLNNLHTKLAQSVKADKPAEKEATPATAVKQHPISTHNDEECSSSTSNVVAVKKTPSMINLNEVLDKKLKAEHSESEIDFVLLTRDVQELDEVTYEVVAEVDTNPDGGVASMAGDDECKEQAIAVEEDKSSDDQEDTEPECQPDEDMDDDVDEIVENAMRLSSDAKDNEEPSNDDTWRFEMITDDSKDKGSDAQSSEEGEKRKRRKRSTALLENLECTICKMHFTLQRELVQHVQMEHPFSKAFPCRFCGNMFSHMQSLTRHMQTHRPSASTNQCEYCPKSFMRTDDLKRHRRVHTGERPYVCSICAKGFKQHSELNAHKLTHSKPKIFVCDICEHRLTSRNGLYLHMKAHRGIKDRVCEFCGKGFLTNGELKTHMKVHGPVKRGRNVKVDEV